MIKKRWKNRAVAIVLAVLCFWNQTVFTVDGMGMSQKVVQVIESTEITETTENTEETESVESTEETEETENTEATEIAESTEETEEIENTETTEIVENTEEIEEIENTETTEITENTEETEVIENAETTESTEKIEATEEIEDTEATDSVKDTKWVLKLETDKKQTDSGVKLSEKNFPDGLFRSYISSTYDTNGDGVLSDAEIAQIVSLDIEKEMSANDKHRKVRSLKGIEYFTKLTKLTCRYMDFIEELDLSNCKSLETVVCDNNMRLTKITLTNCSTLRTFECAYNTELTSIDFTGCSNMTKVELNENGLAKVKLTVLTALKNLYLNESGITSVNLGKLGKLQDVICVGENITQLNVNNCKSLKTLRVESNNLSNLKINGCSAIKELTVVGGELTEIGVGKLTNLKKLDLRKLNLTKLDLSGNTSIKVISCTSNRKKLKADFSGCSNLENVYCNSSKITSLNLSGCTLLRELECYKNLLRELDLSDLENLESLSCSSNKLKYIDLTDCSNLVSISCSDNYLSNLDITKTEVCGISVDNNCYTVKSGKYIDLSNLTGFSMFKISNIQGGKQVSTYSPVLELTDFETNKITYDYDIKYGWNVSFTIYFENPTAKADISTFRMDLSKSSYVYNGKAKRPTVTVEGGLKKGKDYTVSYKKNKTTGIATVIVKGKGNYTGTSKLTFEITPKKVQIKSVTSKTKGQLLVKWNKNTTASGYEICYATKKNFSGNTTTTTIKSKSTVSKRIKGLKSGKRYYVRVRPYKTSGSQKVYGDWSDAVSVITR